ncbi:MAG: vitamin K epoxide reductase family protein [Candidatus Dojkabacteria bacterium]|nr:MAG: vitamin K epoxide reductase family protein [Candidatus Dojkabacteria bacterium]
MGSKKDLRSTTNLIILLLAAAGGLLSLYLWNSTLQGSVDFCTTNCEAVLTSPYSKILGIPVAALGFVYYAGMATLCFQRIHIKHILLDRMLAIAILAGILFTIYLRYLEFGVIEEICMWCWGSVVTMLAITITYVYWVIKDKVKLA